MGRAKEAHMEQDAPSGFICKVCATNIPKDSVSHYFDNGEVCSYCNHVMTKDD